MNLHLCWRLLKDEGSRKQGRDQEEAGRQRKQKGDDVQSVLKEQLGRREPSMPKWDCISAGREQLVTCKADFEVKDKSKERGKKVYRSQTGTEWD